MDVRTIVHRKLRNNSAVILRRVQRCAFTASLRHLWAAPDYELIPSAEGGPIRSPRPQRVRDSMYRASAPRDQFTMM